jgi:multidrug resistance efflux pump
LQRCRQRAAAAQAKYDLLMAGTRTEEVLEAEAEHRRLKATAEMLEKGTREEEKAQALAKLAQARGKLAELDALLAEAEVRAEEACVVELVLVRKGDLAAANMPVVKVLRTADLWVKVYVPETELGKLRLGQEVSVTMDAYPGRRFVGKVVHIGSESEFTPRNVQSVDERRHQMFGVRVRVADPQGAFKSGMAAEVTIPLE